MLMGEHAVLHGYPAVICAVNRYITVCLTPRSDTKVSIHSDLLGDYSSTIDELKNKQSFQFVLAAIKLWRKKIFFGFDLEIHSDFSDRIGLGSSAAVTVATLAALQKWLENDIDLKVIYQMGLDVILAVQGMGSGADITVSVLGGIIAYQTSPFKVEKLKCKPKIHLIYSGHKTPTTEVIQHVRKQSEQQPELFSDLYSIIGEITLYGIQAIKKRDWEKLGSLFTIHQGLQDALGVNNDALSEIIYQARQIPTVLGSKISGSGLGDCAVVLGKMPKNYFPVNADQQQKGIKQISVSITDKGVGVNEKK